MANRRSHVLAARRGDSTHAGIDKLSAQLGLPGASPQQVVETAATEVRNRARVAALRTQLGLPANASGQQVVDTAARAVAARPTGTADEAPPCGANRDVVLDWAARTGRISASSRPHWEASWAQDARRTDAFVRVLAPVPHAAVADTPAASAPVAATAVDPDISALPVRIRQAAARHSDPAIRARWAQQYAGMSEVEVGPESLRLDGEDWLAAEVARDENDVANEARQRWLNEFNENAAAHARHQAAEADALNTVDCSGRWDYRGFTATPG